jgi:hypothetical protein
MIAGNVLLLYWLAINGKIGEQTQLQLTEISSGGDNDHMNSSFPSAKTFLKEADGNT